MSSNHFAADASVRSDVDLSTHSSYEGDHASPQSLANHGGGDSQMPNHGVAFPSSQHERPRSSAIAIARPTAAANTNPSFDSDSSDEEEEDVRRLSTSINYRSAQSLPSRFLRAPLLGSVSTSDKDYRMSSFTLSQDRDQSMLPPPMVQPSLLQHQQQDPSSYSDQHRYSHATTNTSYGSLRESNLQGRFLDGPASYRDKKTGGIMQLQQRVRFQDTTAASAAVMSSSMPAQSSHLLSIGERMRQIKRNKSDEEAAATSDVRKHGTLGDILLASPQHQPDDSSHWATSRLSPLHFDMHQQPPQPLSSDPKYPTDPSNMLSTSLTALEILQKGLLPGLPQATPTLIQPDPPLAASLGSSSPQLQHGPSYRPANNLSRTLSDPTPSPGASIARQAYMPTSSADASGFLEGQVRTDNSTSQLHSFLTARSAAHTSHHHPHPGGVDPYFAHPDGLTVLDQGDDAPETDDENPDAEGAFDMELEL
jgi:hypothetical protein